MNENDFYEEFYRETQDTGVSGWFIKLSHRHLEKPHRNNPNNLGLSILEVGCNIGEHLKYVSPTYEAYLMTDYRDTKPIIQDSRVRFEVADVHELPYLDESFDRVIMTCLLHHISDPGEALSEFSRVTKHGGVISIQLPCDPGLFYRIAKSLGPNRRWRSEIDGHPRYWHYLQHRNHFPGLLSNLKFTFSSHEIKVRWWPFLIPSWNFNLFASLDIYVKKSNDWKLNDSR